MGRDPLTTLISVVAVGAAMVYWLFIRAKADARARRARRQQQRAAHLNNNTGASASSANNNNAALKKQSPAWPSASHNNINNEINEEDEDEDDDDTTNTPPIPFDGLFEDDAVSVASSHHTDKPAAISASDASAVLVTRNDETVSPCRASMAARRLFVKQGGIVRTVAVVLREGQHRNRAARLLLRCDRATGTLCLPAHAPVKFCLDELDAKNGAVRAASRTVREELSRMLATSGSSSSRHLDVVVTLIDNILASSAINSRVVARAEWVAPNARSHELVHIVEMILTPEACEALDRLQHEREGDALYGADSSADTIALVSQSDLASGVLPLHPLLQALVAGGVSASSGPVSGPAASIQQSLLGFGASSSPSSASADDEILRLVETKMMALPAVARSRKTRVGGPRSVIPLVTKFAHLSSMVQMKLSMKKRQFASEDEAICFDLLKKVSRSFAMVIEGLCDELRTPICIYYIVLRALDTVEDDIHISREEKEKHLKAFVYYLDSPEAVPEEVRKYGDGAYLELMAQLPTVVRVHCSLRKEYRETIAATTRRMAEGMLLFLDSQNNVKLHAEYNEYCFYVAGLVGLGLTDMFANSGLEPDLAPGPMCPPHVEAPVKTTVASAYSGNADACASACAMALVLQKTNILRDYKEDMDDARLWWPREVWGCYADKAEDFQTPDKAAAGLACLNQLIVDAMRHLPGCLDYLERIHDPTVFSFCAVPQAMAIATLTTCFNNPNVFHRNVKISKGEACSAMIACRNVRSFAAWAATYVRELRSKTDVDPILFANARSALAAAEVSLSRLA